MEVWLKGNVRPALGLAALAVGVLAAGAGVVLMNGPPAWVVQLAAVAGMGIAAAVSALVWSASRPRLERRDTVLRLRLTPYRAHDVPLEAVECVFLGSQPIVADAAHDADEHRLRVGTLVVRFAERATDCRERPTFGPWGTWQDGHAVVDGRWCEPLSLEVARGVSARLLEAKRQVAGTLP
ncbi:MAG: hypothetical protein EBR23_04155 [Planctomycetia bacterium]|nr:hypothetical protein [Planctomycetia bacterium]